MVQRIWKLTLARVAMVLWTGFTIAALVLQSAVSPALAQEILPHPDKPFAGKIGLTYKTSEPVKSQLKLPSTYDIEDAPNVLLMPIDDTHFAYPRGIGVPEGSSPDLKAVDHTITANVEIPSQGAEGMLMTLERRYRTPVSTLGRPNSVCLPTKKPGF